MLCFATAYRFILFCAVVYLFLCIFCVTKRDAYCLTFLKTSRRQTAAFQQKSSVTFVRSCTFTSLKAGITIVSKAVCISLARLSRIGAVSRQLRYIISAIKHKTVRHKYTFKPRCRLRRKLLQRLNSLLISSSSPLMICSKS